MIWSGLEQITHTAWTTAERHCRRAAAAGNDPRRPRPRYCARLRPRCRRTRRSEHPLQRHVDDAAALAVEPADRRKRERCHVAQRGGAQRYPKRRRCRGGPTTSSRESRGRSRERQRQSRFHRCDHSARCRQMPRRSQRPDKKRRTTVRLRRRQGEPERDPQRDPGEADLLGLVQRLTRASSAQPRPEGAQVGPTKRTTSPSMMMVRFSARSERKIVGSS